jgi:hypothetical protein
VNGRTFARWFVVVLVVSGAATFIWGWWIARGVRVTAAETDRRIRTIAWATLSYYETFGAFPMSEEELLAFGAGSASIAPPSAEAAWPASRDEALAGAEAADLSDSLRSIVAVFGEDRDMPPYLRPDGLPTSVGTTTLVNGWLAARGGVLLRPEAPSRERDR